MKRERVSGDSEVIYTVMHYLARNDAEFRAYWHTVINPAQSGPLPLRGNTLIATDPEGNEYALPATTDTHGITVRYGVQPVAWEFVATDLGNTTLHGIGASVLYSDGHVEYVRYPGPFPMTETVARLGQQYAAEP
jgi:hypothetical protein